MMSEKVMAIPRSKEDGHKRDQTCRDSTSNSLESQEFVMIVGTEKEADALNEIASDIFFAIPAPDNLEVLQDKYVYLTHFDAVLQDGLRAVAHTIAFAEFPEDICSWIQGLKDKELPTIRLLGEISAITTEAKLVFYRDMENTSVEIQEWEAPIFLDCFNLPEMEPLPGILGEYSKAVSETTETPLELSQGLALATIATAIHGKIKVSIKPGYSEPTNIWINVALDPANRKSTVLQKVTAPLLFWESSQGQKLGPKIRDLESQQRNQESRIKSLRARYGKAKQEDLPDIERQIMDLERNLVQVPVFPRIWVQDVTPEDLGTKMALHDGRMAILSAEGGVFDLMAGRYSNGVPNLDIFLQGHSGDSVRVDRGSRESLYIESPALTMGISPQPEVLRRIASAPGFRGRGLLARYLYLLPESNLGHRTLETSPVPHMIQEQWEKVIHSLLNLEPSSDEFGKPVPHVLRLSKQAYNEWLEFSRAVEVELREGGRFEFVRDWAGKLPGATARLAGLLHCVKYPDYPWKEKISLEIMQQALTLGAIFSEHALKVFNLMGCDKTIEAAQKVWRWVERGRFKRFRKRDCHHALQGWFPRVADIEPAFSVLKERNYLSFTKEETGGRPSIQCSVNPVLTGEW